MVNKYDHKNRPLIVSRRLTTATAIPHLQNCYRSGLSWRHIVIIKADLVSVCHLGRYCLSYASLKLTRKVTDFLTCVLLLNRSSHVHRFVVLLRQ